MIPVISVYLCVWVLFLGVLLLDWLFGFDKINQYIDEHMSGKDDEIFLPVIFSAFAGILLSVLYIITGLNLFFYGSIGFGGLSLGLLVLIIAGYIVYRVLCGIRKFFINLRHKD